MPLILPRGQGARNAVRKKPAPSPVRAFPKDLGSRRLLLAAEALEASVEALDAACRVHDALLARVERWDSEEISTSMTG